MRMPCEKCDLTTVGSFALGPTLTVTGISSRFGSYQKIRCLSGGGNASRSGASRSSGRVYLDGAFHAAKDAGDVGIRIAR